MISIVLLLLSVRAIQTNGTGLEVIEGFNIDIKFNQATQMADFTFIMPDKTWMGVILGS
jgi:hypothetical protein